MRRIYFFLIALIGVGSGLLAAEEEERPKPAVAKGNNKAFPKHWGEPPRKQTRDLRKLPGGYGMGSGTLAKWITENLAADEKAAGRSEEKGGDQIALEIKKLKKEIAEMKDFMSRARFTPEGLAEYKAKLEKKEGELRKLLKKRGEKKDQSVPTFEEWVKAGKKIPEGMMFTGGSPWFNESTGTKRSAREVYQMLYPKAPR